LMNKNLNIH